MHAKMERKNKREKPTHTHTATTKATEIFDAFSCLENLSCAVIHGDKCILKNLPAKKLRYSNVISNESPKKHFRIVDKLFFFLLFSHLIPSSLNNITMNWVNTLVKWKPQFPSISIIVILSWVLLRFDLTFVCRHSVRLMH